MSDIREHSMEITDEPTSPLEDARGDADTLANSGDAIANNEVTVPRLPVVEIVQRPMGKLAIPPASRISLPILDGIPMADQLTWVLPAIPKPGKADKQANPPAAQGDAKEKGQTSSDTQGYLSLAFDMIKNVGIYAVGALASPLVSLILTPFLAHHLSPTEYGGLAVLYTVIDLVTVITQLGLSASFFRAYNGDYESQRDRLGVLATSIILLSLASIPIAVAMMLAAPWLSEFLFNSTAFSEPVRLTALVIVLENLTLPGIAWLRAEKRAILYSALSIANLLLVLGTNIVLVGALQMGANGALIAKGAGYAIMIACTYPLMLLLLVRRRSLHLRSDIMWSMLFFGVPTIFGDMAAWVLQLSDRYLLSHLASLAQTASYSVAYTLGGVLSPVLLAPWGLAWVPIMYAVAKRADAAHIYRLVFRWWSSLLLLATFALSLLSTAVLATLFPPAYFSAAPVIPVIALSTLFIGVYYIFMIGVNLRRKTILEFVFMAIAASVNVLLNLFFIPRFGAMGAAVSTLIAYTVLASVSCIVNEKIYPIGFEISPFIMRLLVGVALYVGSSLLAHNQQPLIIWGIYIAALMLYGVFLMVLGGLSVKRLKKAFWYVRAALRKERNKTYA